VKLSALRALARLGRPSRLGPPRWKADQVYRRLAFGRPRATDPRHLVNFACLGIRPRLHRRRAA
jgi:hypothetical protein